MIVNLLLQYNDKHYLKSLQHNWAFDVLGILKSANYKKSTKCVEAKKLIEKNGKRKKLF